MRRVTSIVGALFNDRKAGQPIKAKRQLQANGNQPHLMTQTH